MGSCCIGNNVLSFSQNNINEMFCIFHNENDLTRLLCKLFFLSYIWGIPHKRHHKQEYDHYKA